MKLPKLKENEEYAQIEICRANSISPDLNALTEASMRFCVKNWRKLLGIEMRDKNKKIIGRIANIVYSPAEKILYAYAIIKSDKLKKINSKTVTFIEK